MSKMYPKFRSVDERPGTNEPIWKGIVKIVATICAVFALVHGGKLGLVRMTGNMEKKDKEQRVQAIEQGNTGHEVMLLDQSGTFMGYKMTYDGHDYLKVSNSGGIVHSESCPCKNVEEEEKP